MTIPETVNLHVWPKCNLACVYCYGRFPQRPRSLPGEQWFRVADQLAAAGVRRVTFSGGEPTLHPDILPMVTHARQVGLQTSIISNGAKLSDELLGQLDLVGIDVDSADDETQAAIGRRLPAGRSYVDHVVEVAARVHAARVRLKLNTVVTRHNQGDDLNALVLTLKPAKWKLLQFVEVAGENHEDAGALQVSDSVFQAFVARHASVEDYGIWLVPETATTIRSTYVMIDPEGRLFQHGPQGHVRSAPVLEVGLAAAMLAVGGYDRPLFEQRGGHVDIVQLRLGSRGAQ